MNTFKQQYLALPSDARQAFWLVLSLGMGMLIMWVVVIPVFIHPGWWAQAVTNAVPLAVGLTSLAAAWIILSGRPILGGQIFLSGLTLGMLAGVASLEGLGFLFAGIAFIGGSYVGILLLPKTVTSFVPIIGIVVAGFILIGDLYIPWARDWISPRDQWIAATLAGVLLVIYLVFVSRQFNSLSLGTRLVMVSLVISIVPMIMVSIMSQVSSRNALEENANQSLTASASQIAANLDAFILSNLDSVRVNAQIDEIAEFLSAAPEDRPRMEKNVLDHLSAFGNINPDYISSYGLLDSNGIDIADTNPADMGRDYSDQSYFIEAVRTSLPFASGLSQSPVTGQPSLYFSAPVRNAAGEILGVLRVRFNADILQQLAIHQGGIAGQPSLAMIVNENNILLAHSAAPEHIYKSILPLEDADAIRLVQTGILPDRPLEQLSVDLSSLADGLLLADSQPNFSGWFHGPELERQGNPNLPGEQAAAVRMGTRPWSVVVAEPRDQFIAPVESQNRAIVVIGVTAALIGSVFAVIVSRYLTRPVSRLTVTADRLAGGDLSARSDVASSDEIGILADTFNNMAGQLSSLVGSLEQRVAERTLALATSAEISRRLSTILDADLLVKSVVDQLQAAFNYYHVHIYLYDEARENLVMVGGTGEAGQAMLVRNHQIPQGRGLVGRAAETGAPVLVLDVSKAEDWLPNRFLPETKSELAVPIMVGNEVMGVLDVQQNEVNGLSQGDLDLLQSISSQIAVSLQNARSYAQAQKRADREALLSSITRRIRRTASAEEALQVTVRELGRALGAETTIRLGVKADNGRQEFHGPGAGEQRGGDDGL